MRAYPRLLLLLPLMSLSRPMSILRSLALVLLLAVSLVQAAPKNTLPRPADPFADPQVSICSLQMCGHAMTSIPRMTLTIHCATSLPMS